MKDVIIFIGDVEISYFLFIIFRMEYPLLYVDSKAIKNKEIVINRIRLRHYKLKLSIQKQCYDGR